MTTDKLCSNVFKKRSHRAALGSEINLERKENNSSIIKTRRLRCWAIIYLLNIGQLEMI